MVQKIGPVTYGEDYVGSGTTDLSFTGQKKDTASWLYDFMYRKYNAAHGRWMSPDPAGLAAVDPSVPQTWNRYAYVSNSPLSSTDLFGLDTSTDCGGPCTPSTSYIGGGCYQSISYTNVTDSTGTWAMPSFSFSCMGMGWGYADTMWSQWATTTSGSGGGGSSGSTSPAKPANTGSNCTPLTKGCSNMPTAEEQCVGDFYNSTLGKVAAFGSPLALVPGWNAQWGSTMGDWAEAIVGKGGGILGTGAAGTSGTTELTTLSGTRFVGSTLELWTGTVLGAIEKAAPPAMLATTVLDIGAHARCSALPGGALRTPSEGMFGAIP